MKITCAQLQAHLNRTLAGVYLVSGDEPLQMMETADAIRKAARQQGHQDAVRVATDSTDWINELYTALHSLSLLSPKRFVELDLRGVRLTPGHTKKLTETVNTLPKEVILLIITKRPDAKGPPAWQLASEKAGVLISIWPIKGEQLPQWILQRAKHMQLPLSLTSARWLAEQTEGNLLAAVQELEKLALWQGETTSLSETLEHALKDMIANSARYDIFQLANAMKARESQKALTILSRLLLAGTEPTLILWVITRELRQSSLPSHLLQSAARIDRIIKGAEKGSFREAVERLLLSLSTPFAQESL